MALIVERYSLAGLATNADFARIIRRHTKLEVKADDIARWRREHWQFDDACSAATDDVLAMAASVIKTKIAEGDDVNARWILERRSPAFMPKSKQDIHAGLGTLDEMLARRGRMSDDEAKARGLIEDPDETE